MSSKILVVDDALFQRTICKRILEEHGFIFVEAANGDEALEKIKREAPDLVLLDITLPGKNGLEVLEEIRSGFPHQKVIMVTAQGQKSFILSAMKMGAKDYITKPMNAEKLINVVNKALVEG